MNGLKQFATQFVTLVRMIFVYLFMLICYIVIGREHRQTLAVTTRRKVDIRFCEKFRVPSSETVIGEFECKEMLVRVARRSSKDVNAAALDAAIKSVEGRYI